MCCHYQCSLHHIYANQVNNDDVHQGSENIHSLSSVAREKVGNLLLNMCSILQSNSYDNIWNISWAIVCSFPQGHQSKWVPRSSMVLPHSCHERWETIGCAEPKQIHSVVKKWAKVKWNVGVIGWANKQAPILRPTREWRHAHMISKRVSTKSEVNSYSCKHSTKETYN
jgi:S-methylmethionine-dependent homocysteine/selenocysteine methylase